MATIYTRNSVRTIKKKVDDSDDLKPEIVPCKKMEGWFWHKYDDLSGYLQSVDGKKYMFYDLLTYEYKVDESSKYEVFPINYFYADGSDPFKFDYFDFMEQKMMMLFYLKKE